MRVYCHVLKKLGSVGRHFYFYFFSIKNSCRMDPIAHFTIHLYNCLLLLLGGFFVKIMITLL